MKLIRAFKMKTKVVLGLLALVTLVIATLASLALGVFRDAIQDEVLETSTFFARYLSSSLEGKIQRASRVAENLAATPSLIDLPPDQIQYVLERCIAWSGRIFTDLYYWAPNGRLAATFPKTGTPIGKHYSELPSMPGPVAELKQTGRTVVVGSFREARKGHKALVLTLVGNSGAFLSGLVDFSEWRTFSRAGSRAGYAALIDRQGDIVSIDPDPGLKGTAYRISIDRTAYTPAGLTEQVPGVRRLGPDSGLLTCVGETPVTGGQELLVISPVPILGFQLAVGIPKNSAFHRVDELRTRIWMVTAICWLLAALFGAAFAERITKPLAVLRRHVEDLQRGQYNEDVQWVYDDEIGILGRAINAMARTLRRERVMKDVFGFASERDEEAGETRSGRHTAAEPRKE